MISIAVGKSPSLDLFKLLTKTSSTIERYFELWFESFWNLKLD